MRRPWALPLVPLYGLGLGVKNALADRSLPKQLGWPVVSVGSLSAGGSGKTPVVMMLAELLARHRVGVDVLSRGYGRGSGVVERVDAAGLAARFGDEPVEMARAGLRVFVGAERFAAGEMAETEEQATADPSATLRNDNKSARAHLLDDGFQHRRLGRSVDVVLLTLEDAQDWLLPAGNLREPLRSLLRADVVVVREEEAEALAGIVAAHTQAQVWVVRRELRLPATMPTLPVAFCGIARPEGFFAMLREAGCGLAGELALPDHHAFRAEDYERLAAAALDQGADGFVTTAKDAARISPQARAGLERVGPVAVAALRVSLLEEDRCWLWLRDALKLHEKMGV